MRHSITLCGAMAVLLCATAGCSSEPMTGPRVVNWYGVYTLDDELELEVSAQGMTRMKYALRHAPSDHVLVSGMASDSKGWFFVWDDRERLWAHWNDVGTIVWVPSGYMAFEKHWLTPDSPLLYQMPPEVSDNLPKWVKRSLEK